MAMEDGDTGEMLNGNDHNATSRWRAAVAHNLQEPRKIERAKSWRFDRKLPTVVLVVQFGRCPQPDTAAARHVWVWNRVVRGLSGRRSIALGRSFAKRVQC